MNKIYNNLNVDNLMKTDWFNQFNKEQQEEILEGLENELDVSIYAKPELNEYQMNEIRRGLKDNLDISVYAKTDFDEEQMHEIRLKLLQEKNFIKK